MRLALLFLSGWVLCLSAGAQPTPPKSEGDRYPFLNHAENCLHMPGNPDALDRFFTQVAEVRAHRRDRLQVLHIGGSHVQGGTFARSIQEGLAHGLLDSAATRGPGFCFPYALAGTNAPASYITLPVGAWEGYRAVKQPDEGPFGLSATLARTRTPYAGFQFYVLDPALVPYPYRRVRLYYDMSPEGVAPVPLGWHCPDSIRVDSTAGCVEWWYTDDQEILDVILMPGPDSLDHNFSLHGVEFWHPDRKLTYHTVGANGASLSTYLKCEALPAHAASLAPDLVIFGIGVNDANGPNGRFDAAGFERRYEELMDSFKTANPEVTFVFFTNNDTWYKKRNVNRNALTVQKVMYDLAEKHGAVVWDQFEVMGGLNSIVAWQRAGLAKSDRVHFTGAGYKLLGELFAEAMAEAWESWCHHKTAME